MADGGDGNVLVGPWQSPIEEDLYARHEVDYEIKTSDNPPSPNPHEWETLQEAAGLIMGGTPSSQEDEFFRHLCNFAQMGLAIAKSKNTDYAGNGDPFANFRMTEALGVSLPRGILVRKADKLSRMSNLLTRPPAVADESLIQTCIDDAMYSLILAVFIKMHPEAEGDGRGS